MKEGKEGLERRRGKVRGKRQGKVVVTKKTPADTEDSLKIY